MLTWCVPNFDKLSKNEAESTLPMRKYRKVVNIQESTLNIQGRLFC